MSEAPVRTSMHEMRTPGDRTVAIVVTIGDQAPFIADALGSCIRQTVRPTKILLADADGPAQEYFNGLAASFPEIAMHRLETESPDLAKVSSDFVVFLDAG